MLAPCAGPYHMTTLSRFFMLWIVFMVQALAVGMYIYWNSPLVDVAMIFVLPTGVATSAVIALACRHKNSGILIVLGTVLNSCSAVITAHLFANSPAAIVMLVIISGFVLWITIPDAPLGDGFKHCSHCGYCITDTHSNTCPECGFSRKYASKDNSCKYD